MLFRLSVLLFDNSLTTSSYYAALHDKTENVGEKRVVAYFKKCILYSAVEGSGTNLKFEYF